MNTNLLNDIINSSGRVTMARAKLVSEAKRLNKVLNSISAEDEIPANVVDSARKAVESSFSIVESDVK